jgi:Macrocin-O-methyltransferase (TylF)
MPQDVQPGETLSSVLSALQKEDVRRSLADDTKRVVERELFGRHSDSFDIDRLAWLAAGVSSSEYALVNMRNAKRCRNAQDLLGFALSQVPSDLGLFLEFGVFSGTSINFIAKNRPQSTIYGFDSFKGLPETWRPGFPKGAFSLSNLPNVVENVELIHGWFDRTLPTFCEEHPDKPVAFLHVDCDLYSSTQTIFSLLKNRFIPGTIVVFDEYFNYPGWQLHESKAFGEFCDANLVQCQFIALVPHHQQVAIRVTGIG